MKNRRFPSIAKSLARMPYSISQEIIFYYVNKILGRKPTDHQTIWTSFLYFSVEHVSNIIKIGEVCKIDFAWEGKKITTEIRLGKSTDIFVFFQVFIANGYKPLLDFLHARSFTPNIVVDAGANVGYFSILMLNFHPCDVLLAIEPEKSNYSQLVKNIENHQNNNKYRLLQAALWTHKMILSLDLGLGGEWATKVTEKKTDHNCQAFSIGDVMNQNGISKIDVLKLDIEGAEEILFRNSAFLEVLENVKIIAIEIHDELADRKMIQKELKRMNFKFFEQGELTVAWNTKLVNE